MNKKIAAFYEDVNDYISENLDESYVFLYESESEIESVGAGIRLNPCPMCGHSDCATAGVAVNCFSPVCDWRGSHSSAYIKYVESEGLPFREAIAKLEELVGIKFPANEKEGYSDYKEGHKTELIYSAAQDHYHRILMSSNDVYLFNGKSYTPLEYLRDVRGHSTASIKDMKIGFVQDYQGLHKKLLEMGFSVEDIKKSSVWCPESVFVYYYNNPLTKEVARFNIKNPFNMTMFDRRNNKQVVIKGFSQGEKVPFTNRKFNYSKDIIIVEGEDDGVALDSQGFSNYFVIGGNVGDGFFKKFLSKAKSKIYVMTDNDTQGQVYKDNINKELPGKDIYSINYPEDISDPNDYYKLVNPYSPDELMSEHSKLMKTEGYHISHEGRDWSIKNRHKELTFTIKKKGKNGIIGDARLTQRNKEVDIEVNKALTNLRADKKPFSLYLFDSMNTYYNDPKGKTVEELAFAYQYTDKQSSFITELANLVKINEKDEDYINKLKLSLRTADGRDDVFDEVLRELNNLNNQNIVTDINAIPVMKISQYFNCKNNDAYMYFLKHTRDGDTLRRLPYLLRNDGEMIRLDLLKRKDENCLLLVDNKYELPEEISEAIMDAETASLTQAMAEKFANGEIEAKDVDTKVLVDELRDFFFRFYHTRDSFVYDILALYTMATYYYELFDQMPYLFINGEKGTGKSVIGKALKLVAFNAKMATNITEASLFRITSLEGGTLILDEMETLNNRKAGSEAAMGSVLKGGYKKRSYIYRSEKDSSISTVKYDAYGPKIIINVFGLDDIIEDRCLPITTYRYVPTRDSRKESPEAYQERLDEIKDLTSRCCISALLNFQEVREIFDNSLFESNNARLSEIVAPLLVIARFADKEEREAIKKEYPDTPDHEIKGRYERSLEEYYVTTLSSVKAHTEGGTPEGIVKSVVQTVAEELYGTVPEGKKLYTTGEGHKYNKPINYNMSEGYFELDLIHLKCFIEENLPGEQITTRSVAGWIRTCFDIRQQDMRRVTTTIDNNDLKREFNNNERPKVQSYKFYFRDFMINEMVSKSNIEDEEDENIIKSSADDDLV